MRFLLPGEVPKLVATAASHEDVQFLGVDTQDSRSGAGSFIADKGITYPSVFDPAGAVLTDQGALGLPGHGLRARDGSVASTVKGELSQSSLDEGFTQSRPDVRERLVASFSYGSDL